MIRGNRIIVLQISYLLFSGSCEYVALHDMRFCSCGYIKDFDKEMTSQIIWAVLPVSFPLVFPLRQRKIESGRDVKMEQFRRKREERMERGRGRKIREGETRKGVMEGVTEGVRQGEEERGRKGGRGRIVYCYTYNISME